jgi:hypothetical protein
VDGRGVGVVLVGVAALAFFGAFFGVVFVGVFVTGAAGLDFSVRVGAGLGSAGVGVVGVGVGVCEVGVGEGDGLDDPAGTCSDSHDSPPDVVAALAAVVLPTTARLTPETAVNRTLPVMSVTVAGRACANRMKTSYQCCSSRYATHWNIKRPVRRHPLSYPIDGGYHCGNCNHTRCWKEAGVDDRGGVGGR